MPCFRAAKTAISVSVLQSDSILSSFVWLNYWLVFTRNASSYPITEKERGKKSGKSEEEEEEEDRIDEEEVTMGNEIDKDDLVETIKAFQRFNGYPETGELTEDQVILIVC